MKSFDDKAVTILEDDHAVFYVVAKEDNHILKRTTRLGSVGFGKLLLAEAGAQTEIVPFNLPNGDKTVIEVQLTNTGEEGEAKEGAKFKRGSLYMIMKELHKLNGMQDVTITSYGKVSPVRGNGPGGKHGFHLNTPPPEQEFHYLLKGRPDAKQSSGNVFRKLATKGPLSAGVAWMWRFQWSEVHSKLTARKPFLVVQKDLKLEKNRPVKLAWIG